MEILTRKVVEATARAMGPDSAAAEALEYARSIGEPIMFLKHGETILVMKQPLKPEDDYGAGT